MTVREVAPLVPNAGIDEMRQALADLIEYIRQREPQASGALRDKFITWSAAEDSGLAKLVYSAGGTGGGYDGGTYEPPEIPTDTSPPTPITGLVVTGMPGFFFVEFDAPTYTHGGGNAYTEVWGANYSGSGPLPTFANAVLLGTVTGRGTMLVLDVEPGTTTHFWVGAVTQAGTKQVDTTGPTGGTNGVAAVADQLEGTHIKYLTVESAHIISLAAAKLTAGSIGVSEYIQSTGFVSGSAGWRIRGDGVAEFSGVIVRGTMYASAGAIGGALIDATGVKSTNYDGAGNGWRLDNSLGQILAGSVKISNVGATRVFDTTATGTSPVLKVGSALSVLANGDASMGNISAAGDVTVASGGAVKSGQTAFGIGTGFWLGSVAGVPKFSIGSSTSNLQWNGSALYINGTIFDTFSASIAGGNISFNESSGDPWPSRTVTPSGGRAPYSYQWAVIPTKYESNVPGSEPAKVVPLVLEGSTTATCTVKGVGVNSVGDKMWGHLGCIVTDANGRRTYTRVSLYMMFQAPSPGSVGSAE